MTSTDAPSTGADHGVGGVLEKGPRVTASTAAKIIAQVGLGLSTVGVVLLAWASRVLILASSNYDGIRQSI
jgi:hypothetical protein